MPHTSSPAVDQSVDALLAAAEHAARAESLAAARKFELAATWAEAHPALVEESVVDEYGELAMFADQPVTLAGEGAPGMSEFAVAEFAAAIGVSTYAGRALIGAALEAKYRLPKIWARAMRGEVAVWKVRRVTEHTHRLPQPAAAQVDADLAGFLHDCSFAQIERAVTAAAAEVDDERFEDRRIDRWQSQHLDIRLADAAGNDGLVPVEGLLDYPDALALETAIAAKAHQLLAEHPELDLDLRRAMAAGHLGDAEGEGTREVVIYTHHTPDAGHRVIDVEGPSGPGVTGLEQLYEWCHDHTTRVSIRPVLDLDAELCTEGYRPTDQQREQAILTCPTCVFPGCGRSARRCDLDHITAYAPGGRTTSWNLAPLCRFHHRLKTHGGWTYRRLTRTSFEWTSPSGRTYLVDLTHRRRRTR